MRRHFKQFSLLTLALCLSLLGAASAAGPRAAAQEGCVRYGAFSRNVSYVVAKREGFFEREGLTVCYNQVRSSDQQWGDLFADRYDIISAASDTTVTRVVNMGLPVSIVAGLEMNNDQVLAVNTARGVNTF
jgi:ABC-type nitrate/sulfonate/bicarbonate transport system substrate-binding protein